MFPAFASGSVVINEIAWMGTAVSANDEWIELYNNGSENIDLVGWRLVSVDGQPDISFSDACTNTTITAGGYFLLERTDDETVPDILADCIYTGALGNTSEQLQLLNASGSAVDSVNATDGWPAGDNTTKETMQKNVSAWITAISTPKVVNISTGASDSSQNDSETDAGNTSSSNAINNTQAGGADEPYVQPENLPHIKASAGVDQFAAVGEQVQFRAHAWGLDNKALENARYVWNFGDGATYEGQNVGHEYMFPGTYIARVLVSSGKYSALDDMRVTVRENTIMISELMSGEDGWIEFQNTGGKAIHVGGWILETTSSRFIIPLGTTIAPQSFAVLSAATTHVVSDAKGDHVYLFYPNGTYASGFSYVFHVPQGKSISSNAGVSVFTKPTPGSPNALEHILTPDVTQQVISTPFVSHTPATQPSTKQSSPQIILEQKEPVAESDTVESDRDSILQSATLADAPALSKMNQEMVWFGGSLVLGGLAAVGVVLFRSRKHSPYS